MSRAIPLLLFGFLLLGPRVGATAQVGSSVSASSPAESALSLAAAEGALLHLKLPLDGVEILKATNRVWQPLTLPSDRVVVINLWTESCEPCKREMPVLAALHEEWRRQPKVTFLFIAEPPMSREQVAEFWANPFLSIGSDERCHGSGVQLVRGPTGSRCLLPHIESEPARSQDQRMRDLLNTRTQPLTLLLDTTGVIRQAWVGSLLQRRTEVSSAIRRLLSLNPRR